MNHVDIRVAPQEPWYKYGVAVLLFEIAVVRSAATRYI
jgi:hypothetical protein